jgi:hypothetical protein
VRIGGDDEMSLQLWKHIKWGVELRERNPRVNVTRQHPGGGPRGLVPRLLVSSLDLPELIILTTHVNLMVSITVNESTGTAPSKSGIVLPLEPHDRTMEAWWRW